MNGDYVSDVGYYSGIVVNYADLSDELTVGYDKFFESGECGDNFMCIDRITKVEELAALF